MQNQVLFVTDHPFEPIDEFDRACMVHDKCWDALGSGCIGASYLNLWSYDWDSSFDEKSKVRLH